MWRLITAAAEKLAEGGVLILETPNPESLLAGSINFHRDPTHVRPVHPETLAFLCRERRLPRRSRSGDSRRSRTTWRLPQSAGWRQPLAEHIDDVVEQLNELIYGYQDYALIARL